MRVSNAYIKSIGSNRYLNVESFEQNNILLLEKCNRSLKSCSDEVDKRNLTFLISIPKNLSMYTNSRNYKKLLIENLKKYEVCPCIQRSEFSSIYFEGDSNFIKKSDYKDIMDYILSSFSFNRPEVIFELDGSDVTSSEVLQMMKFGFNKLIINLKTFDNKTRKALGLEGNASNIIKSIEEILDNGFKNIYLKIAYNYENFDNEVLIKDMKIINNLDIAGFIMEDEKKTPKKDNNVRKSFSIITSMGRDVCYDFSKSYQMTRCKRDLRKFQKNIKNDNDILPIGLGARGKIGNNIIINPSSIEKLTKFLELEKGSCVFKPSKEYTKIKKVTTMVDEMFIDIEKFEENEKSKLSKFISNLLSEKFLERSDEIYTLTDKGIYWSEQIKNELIHIIS
ncbi:MAG: hypothetical protein ACTIH2_00665 [Anaerococcus sp.]